MAGRRQAGLDFARRLQHTLGLLGRVRLRLKGSEDPHAIRCRKQAKRLIKLIHALEVDALGPGLKALDTKRYAHRLAFVDESCEVLLQAKSLKSARIKRCKKSLKAQRKDLERCMAEPEWLRLPPTSAESN